jgi:hypothetical protein
VVDFFSYPLQQDILWPSSSPTSPPVIRRHPIVLRPQQPKTAKLVASAVAVLASPGVLHSPSSKPLAFSDADRYVVWHDAMCDEFKALRSNHTWSLVPFHPSINVIGSKWVYWIKHHVDGSIEHYKAHLIARDFT